MRSSGQPVEPVGRPLGPGPLIVVGLAIALVIVAVVKPWGGASGPGSSPVPPAGSADVLIQPSQTASPEASRVEDACNPDAGWRLFTVEVNAGRAVRTWYSISPVAASGPTDGSIPTIRIYTEGLGRLGYCAGSSEGGSAAFDRASGWRVDAAGKAQPIALVRAAEPGLDGSGRSALFEPPGPLVGDRPGDWPPGRYVLSVGPGETVADRLWFAAQVVTVDGATSASGSPPSGPTTRP